MGNIIYNEGDKYTSQPGRVWVTLTRHAADFDAIRELHPVYILRWQVTGEPVEDWGEYGRELGRNVIDRGRVLLPDHFENDAAAIRLAIAKYDELKDGSESPPGTGRAL